MPTREATEFAKLFDGRKDVRGTNKGGVIHGVSDWAQAYQEHLAGKVGLGVFPVRDDNTVLFGAIDLDEPDFVLAVELQSLLPGTSWIERSRSGNAHIWVFFDAPLECWAAKAILRSATMAVGRPDVEVFPKQEALRDGMVGNYINLPFYGDTRPILPNETQGTRLALEQFLEQAEAQRCSASEWRDRAKSMGAGPPELRESTSDFRSRSKPHMCATYMLEHKDDNPLQVGHRAVVLFNLAKMLANVETFDEDEVLELVEDYNQAGEEAVPASEVARFVGNAFRGEFTSTGCDDALMTDYVHPNCPIAHG